jgi:hypothetical protein
MKIVTKKNLITALIITIAFSFLFYAHQTGVTGKTLKTSNLGCDCHSPTLSSNVLVSINGPSEIEVGEDADFTVTISGGPLAGGGVNIAASAGILTPQNGLKLVDGELTHTTPRPAAGGTVTFNFEYRAPEVPGQQTLFATGNSVNLNGQPTGDEWNFAPNKIINVVSTTSVDDGILSSYKLNQNYPNPFNPSTEISFTLAEAGNVRLTIYNSLGEELKVMVNEYKHAGNYSYSFNAESFSSGIYYYKLDAGGSSEIKKMVLLR